MTKEQFLAGTEFRRIGYKHGTFKYVPSKDGAGHIIEITRYSREWNCNLKKATKTGIYVYSTVCSKSVRAYLKFSELEIVEPVGGTVDAPVI
jgi:hypothetical protein